MKGYKRPETSAGARTIGVDKVTHDVLKGLASAEGKTIAVKLRELVSSQAKPGSSMAMSLGQHSINSEASRVGGIFLALMSLPFVKYNGEEATKLIDVYSVQIDELARVTGKKVSDIKAAVFAKLTGAVEIDNQLELNIR